VFVDARLAGTSAVVRSADHRANCCSPCRRLTCAPRGQDPRAGVAKTEAPRNLKKFLRDAIKLNPDNQNF
jgi:hypothetical protein